MRTWDLIELRPNRRYRARLSCPDVGNPRAVVTLRSTTATAEFETDSGGAICGIEESPLIKLDSMTEKFEVLEITDLASEKSVDLRLFAAACCDSTSLAREALRDDIDPNIRVRQGSRALHIAALNGRTEILEMLLCAGAEIDAADELGWTPLLESVKHDPRMLRLLVDQGANINLATKRGYTPLMRAAGTGREAAAELLLAFGANPALRNCEDKTAYRLSMEMQEYACAALVGDALCTKIIHDHKEASLADGFELRPVSPGDRMMIDMARRTVGGKVHRLYLIFDDDSRLEDLRLIDEVVLEVPLQHAHRKVKAVGVPFEQG